MLDLFQNLFMKSHYHRRRKMSILCNQIQQAPSGQIMYKNLLSLLTFMALSAAQSSAQTHIHSAILVFDTSNNAS